MKIYYYVFTKTGEVTRDVITARKNKYSYAIDKFVTYDGRTQCCSSKLFLENENKIMGSNSTSSIGCYMFSTTIKEITADMKAFAVERAEKILKIISIEREAMEIAEILSDRLNSFE